MWGPRCWVSSFYGTRSSHLLTDCGLRKCAGVMLGSTSLHNTGYGWPFDLDLRPLHPLTLQYLVVELPGEYLIRRSSATIVLTLGGNSVVDVPLPYELSFYKRPVQARATVVEESLTRVLPQLEETKLLSVRSLCVSIHGHGTLSQWCFVNPVKIVFELGSLLRKASQARLDNRCNKTNSKPT